MSVIKLSVAIITYNEENNIGRCISSVLPIADEILVVDSFSTDRTKEICESFNVRFLTHTFEGHIEQKNVALDLANFEHVLSLDADEALSPELAKEILNVKKDFRGSGYSFNRLTNYNGFWVKHCGWYPDRKLRLVNKNKARWSGENPHDYLALQDGQSAQFLKGDLLHYSYESISAHIKQTNKFTTIAARAAFKNGKRSSLLKIILRPIFKFLRDYFFKLGFLDGRTGFVICVINGYYALLKYAKLHDLQNGKNI